MLNSPRIISLCAIFGYFAIGLAVQVLWLDCWDVAHVTWDLRLSQVLLIGDEGLLLSLGHVSHVAGDWVFLASGVHWLKESYINIYFIC